MAEQKIEKDRKIYQDVFDALTLRTIETHIARKNIADVEGIVKSGKEAQIFRASTPTKKQVIIKIYMIETSSFQNMADYIIGDHRFYSVAKNKRKLVYLWCAKEFRNLKKAHSAGVSVPEPHVFLNNTLVMELIGDNSSPSPQLIDIELENPQKMYGAVLSNMKKLYFEAGLVHADLSEYNILVKDGNPVFIDMGQSVLPDHPMAKEFLERDVRNIVNYFNKQGLKLDCKKVMEEFRDSHISKT